jgi:hypothetical protein
MFSRLKIKFQIKYNQIKTSLSNINLTSIFLQCDVATEKAGYLSNAHPSLQLLLLFRRWQVVNL